MTTVDKTKLSKEQMRLNEDSTEDLLRTSDETRWDQQIWLNGDSR